MTIERLVGIYNADGGIVGEVRYVLGHLLGTAECALCDITHSPIRRKPEWDQMASELRVPLTLLHRNELDERTLQAISTIALPAIIGFQSDGEVVEVLSATELSACEGSVARCGEMIRTKLG
jgi:hypothetical protein